MNEKLYWRWKSTIIDFSKIPDEYSYGIDNSSKKDDIFRYLPLPDEKINEWENGWYSTEYNLALGYAEEYGLIEFIEEEEWLKKNI